MVWHDAWAEMVTGMAKMVTCLTCAMFCGDPDHAFGWCYEHEQPCSRDNPQCELARQTLRDEPLEPFKKKNENEQNL